MLCSTYATGITICYRPHNCSTHDFGCCITCLLDCHMLQTLLPNCISVFSAEWHGQRMAIATADTTHCCAESPRKPHARLGCSRVRGKGWSAGPPGPPSLQCPGPAWGQAVAFCAPAGLGRHRLAGTQAAPCRHQLTLCLLIAALRYNMS